MKTARPGRRYVARPVARYVTRAGRTKEDCSHAEAATLLPRRRRRGHRRDSSASSRRRRLSTPSPPTGTAGANASAGSIAKAATASGTKLGDSSQTPATGLLSWASTANACGRSRHLSLPAAPTAAPIPSTRTATMGPGLTRPALSTSSRPAYAPPLRNDARRARRLRRPGGRGTGPAGLHRAAHAVSRRRPRRRSRELRRQPLARRSAWAPCASPGRGARAPSCRCGTPACSWPR